MSGEDELLLDLSLARGALDRDAARRSDPAGLRHVLGDQATRVFDLADGRARTCRVDGTPRLVLRSPSVQDTERLVLYLGRDPGGRAYLAAVRDVGDPADCPDTGGKGWSTLREVGADLDDIESGALTTAMALSNWHARHTRCPRCGAATEASHGGWVRRCTQDGSEHHPRTDTAVIMAVTDPQDRILLARGPHWPAGRMSVLAGFVEAGETLEAAVAREVREEIGVEVEQVTYRGNQPWPFPASLMVGFTARATSADLVLDDAEIAEAAWFTRGEVSWGTRSGSLALPPRVSIARHLIEQWHGGTLEQAEELSGPFRGSDPS